MREATKPKLKKKISSTQAFVLNLLSNGWELGHSKGFKQNAWVQKGGVGRGGESRSISMATFNCLIEIKAIEITTSGYPTDKYKITESARKVFKNP